MTFKAAKEYKTRIGNFCYYHISRATYPIGITQIKEGDNVYIMATPEKALCDGPQSLKPAKFEQLMKELKPIADAVGKEI